MRFNTSLRRRIAGLLLAFALLVALSLALISWTRATQQQDALLINLAARQDRLIEQMVSEALEAAEEQDDQPRHLAAVQEAAGVFEKTLYAMIDGGQASDLHDDPVDMPAAKSPSIQTRLHQVHHTWDTFRGYLDVIVAAEPNSPEFTAAIQSLERLSPQLAQEADEVVKLYEAASVQNAARLRWIQIAFFASALGLLAIGYLLTQKNVLKPLRALSSMTEGIARGDLNTPIQVTGPREIEAMAHSLDTMRVQLKTSQADLIKRAKTLESGVAQRTRELEVAFELSQDIVTEFELDQLLSSVTDRARDLMRAQTSILCLLDPNGQYLAPAAASGEIAVQAGFRQSVGPGLVSQGVGAGEAVSAEAGCANCRLLDAYAAGQCAAAALRVGEHTLGALCVCRSGQRRFEPDETRALTLLANSAAVAIANTYLLESAQRHAQQAATLAERERLAAELHDNLAQILSFLNLKTDRLKELLTTGHSAEAGTELGRMQAALNGAYDQVRAALIGLREPLDDTSGLAEELAAYLAEFEQASGMRAELSTTHPGALALAPVASRQALHIVREALTNARRHAQARRVWVRVERITDGNEACFIVEDDGCGFDVANAGGGNHLGLNIMRARAERCGGRLAIDSTPGAGTKVVVHFPLEPE